jgi:hypothetical protein
MTEQPKRPIDEAFAAARELPQTVQEALAAEIMSRVDQLGHSGLSEEQRAEIEARLAMPAVYADGAAARDLFERFGARG